jgi:hypothetical protein
LTTCTTQTQIVSVATSIPDLTALSEQVNSPCSEKALGFQMIFGLAQMDVGLRKE